MKKTEKKQTTMTKQCPTSTEAKLLRNLIKFLTVEDYSAAKSYILFRFCSWSYYQFIFLLLPAMIKSTIIF